MCDASRCISSFRFCFSYILYHFCLIKSKRPLFSATPICQVRYAHTSYDAGLDLKTLQSKYKTCRQRMEARRNNVANISGLLVLTFIHRLAIRAVQSFGSQFDAEKIWPNLEAKSLN